MFFHCQLTNLRIGIFSVIKENSPPHQAPGRVSKRDFLPKSFGPARRGTNAAGPNQSGRVNSRIHHQVLTSSYTQKYPKAGRYLQFTKFGECWRPKDEMIEHGQSLKFTTCWIFNFHPWIGIATGPLTWVKLPSALYVFHGNFQCQKSNLHKNNTVPWIAWCFQWFHPSHSYIICLSTSSSKVLGTLEVGSLSHRLGTRKLFEIVQHLLLTNYISYPMAARQTKPQKWPSPCNSSPEGRDHGFFLGTQTCGTCKSTGICWHSFWTSRNWRYSLDSSTRRWQKPWKKTSSSFTKNG